MMSRLLGLGLGLQAMGAEGSTYKEPGSMERV